MTLRRYLLLAALALGLVVVLRLALRSERVLTAGLPLRIVAKTQDEARTLAGLGAVAVLGNLHLALRYYGRARNSRQRVADLSRDDHADHSAVEARFARGCIGRKGESPI